MHDMATAKRRKAAKQEVLARIAEEVAAGNLVIRQMTLEEREHYGPPKNLPVPKGRRRELVPVV